MNPAVHLTADVGVIDAEHALFSKAHDLDLMFGDAGVRSIRLLTVSARFIPSFML